MQKDQVHLREEIYFMKKELERKENILDSRVSEGSGSSVLDGGDADLAWALNAVIVTMLALLAIAICCMCVVIRSRRR